MFLIEFRPVFDTYAAIKEGRRVKLCAFISDADLCWGNTEKDACIKQSYNPVSSSKAVCGVKADKKGIYKYIKNVGWKFKEIDKAIDLVYLQYLVSYPTEKIEYNKTDARDKIKSAIDQIITRLGKGVLKTFDSFVKYIVIEFRGFKMMERPEYISMWDDDHYYYIVGNGNKIDVFSKWSEFLLYHMK